MSKTAQEHSLDLQTKFELYSLGLTFTLLGAAVQTADFQGTPLSGAFELAGWMLLLLSALVGLWRFPRVSPLYQLQAQMHTRERQRDRIAELPPDQEVPTAPHGKLVPAALVVERLDETLDQGEQLLESGSKQMARLFSAHMWFLFGGLLCLATARASDHVTDIISAIQHAS